MSELRDEDDIICYFDNLNEVSALTKNLSDKKLIDLIGKRLHERHWDWVLGTEE